MAENNDIGRPQIVDHLAETAIGQLGDPVAARLLREYGAVFVARGGAVPPDRIIFRDEAEVAEFQGRIETGTLNFGEITIELQSAAALRLSSAIAEAADAGLSITPRGADSGRRSYTDTVSLWKSRVEPALDHWTGMGRLDLSNADRIRGLSPFEQVAEVFDLEAKGLFFAKDLTKSIVYSVAPPGTSQHLAMLAFDVAEFDVPAVRGILARHYWYQTVTSDLPHFTFLGAPESELPQLGLKSIENAGRQFWVPDV